MNADDTMIGATAAQPNTMVPWYILSSYAYYHLDSPVLSDAAFDALAVRLLSCWDVVEHPHKHLITEDALRAGTLLLAEDEYPGIAKGSANSILREMRRAPRPSILEIFYMEFLKR